MDVCMWIFWKFDSEHIIEVEDWADGIVQRQVSVQDGQDLGVEEETAIEIH